MRTSPDLRLRAAVDADAGELLTLQRAAFVSEAQEYGDPMLPPLRETLEQVRAVIADALAVVLVAEVGADGSAGRAGRLVGAARLHLPPPHGDAGRPGQVSRVAVAPDVQGAGIGSRLMRALHELAEGRGVTRLDLFTGGRSGANIAFYHRLGYAELERRTDDRGVPLQVMRREA